MRAQTRENNITCSPRSGEPAARPTDSTGRGDNKGVGEARWGAAAEVFRRSSSAPRTVEKRLPAGLAQARAGETKRGLPISKAMPSQAKHMFFCCLPPRVHSNRKWIGPRASQMGARISSLWSTPLGQLSRFRAAGRVRNPPRRRSGPPRRKWRSRGGERSRSRRGGEEGGGGVGRRGGRRKGEGGGEEGGGGGGGW